MPLSLKLFPWSAGCCVGQDGTMGSMSHCSVSGGCFISWTGQQLLTLLQTSTIIMLTAAEHPHCMSQQMWGLIKHNLSELLVCNITSGRSAAGGKCDKHPPAPSPLPLHCPGSRWSLQLWAINQLHCKPTGEVITASFSATQPELSIKFYSDTWNNTKNSIQIHSVCLYGIKSQQKSPQGSLQC